MVVRFCTIYLKVLHSINEYHYGTKHDNIYIYIYIYIYISVFSDVVDVERATSC
jgi:hypothetical protein